MAEGGSGYHPERPLILQSDRSVLLEVNHPEFEAARDFLSRIAELERSPEYVHTYRISSLSLWNAAAAGLGVDEVLRGLERYSKFPLPENVRVDVRETMARYGRLKLLREAGRLLLEADDPLLLDELLGQARVKEQLGARVDPRRVEVPEAARGFLKQALLRSGFPVVDLAGHRPGERLDLRLRSSTRSGRPFALRPYQEAAADAFWAGGGPQGGSGVVVLPCGAGKTMVGLAVMERAQARTLVLCTHTTAVRQWIQEILDKTTLPPEAVGEYTADRKAIRPVTVATYSILTERRQGDYPHFALFDAQDWGLIIYDEVHLLPAPLFRLTAGLQARRRLGLTATLVREDGREDDVFSLIGPKRFDLPWKELERQGWIATAECVEIRVPVERAWRERYALAEPREQFRLASENPLKADLAQQLVEEHVARGDRVLVIGAYVGQVDEVARRLGIPALTGRTAQRRRERLFDDFRQGRLPALAVSRVASFSVDLPEASVAIELSGVFGSRQEEAQRLGRILRPKRDGRSARFYALVSHETVEQEFAARRQRFLAEQGYRYRILRAEAAGAGEEADGPVPPVTPAGEREPLPRLLPFPGGGRAGGGAGERRPRGEPR
ncbi:MAG: helicase-associated domain-containing protein [Bacillota bacterium]|nr:helicase-associated domain-containing protein [Bacillota bacterium]